MTQTKTLAIAFSIYSAMAVDSASASTQQMGKTSVVVMAGQTIEIPLSSDHPISGDLTARGAFEHGDVTFTDGPGCHLSAHGCTLMITAAPTSRSYTSVPVLVSESAAKNTAIFSLSVIRPEESAPADTKLLEIVSTPLRLSRETRSDVGVEDSNTSKPSPPAQIKFPSAGNPSEQSIQRSGNSLFYAEVEPRPGLEAKKKNDGRFTSATNGPSYQIVSLTNHDASQSLSVELTGSGASHFTIEDSESKSGSNRSCAAMKRIDAGESCMIIIKGEVGDPRKEPETAILNLRGENKNVARFELATTTYVYAAGGFDTLGDANVSGGSLLAQCTAGTCSNALQGTSGNNYASTNFSVGQWINALAITPAGNLMVGGVFGAIGGATSGASSGTAALLAQCTPGPVVGNACINQMETGGTSSPYAFNNAYINGISIPFAIAASDYMAVVGDFTSLRVTSVNAGQKMLAKCLYNGTSSSATCNNYLGNAAKYGNSAIVTVNTLGSASGAPLVHVGGLFTQIASYPGSAPASGTTFATCSTTACSQGMDTDNPNNSVLGMTDDGTNLYMGGTFTQIGGYTDSGGGYPLVSCTPGSPTTCANALAGSNDANGYIQGLTYSGGNLYVGGKFTSIGGATPVSGGKMLAVCTPGGTCSNFVTDTNPYSTGSDWGGGISAIAVGSQTTIKAR